MRIAKYSVLIFLLSFLFLSSSAMAKSIFEHQNTVIPANQTVDDVVIIGGDADILGTVNSSIIIINGNAHIHSSAHIDGFVLIIGGTLEQDTGAVITNDVINISFDDATKNSLLIGGGLVLGIWVVQLAGSLMMLLVPILMFVFGKKGTADFVEQYREVPPGRILYTGFFSGLILAAVTILLLLTVIGIPLILLVGLIVIVSFAFGLTALSHFLGERFQDASGKAGWIVAAIGAFVLMASVNIPFVGGIILLLMLLFSLGITTIWLVEKLRRRRKV
ncbi:hypothetical protein [Paenibacillus sp. GP183]|uniref:hypothetical protein n=1 Tax=Paenibacillus sp. GP183 TaxID=1882751 RepID=UPI0008999CFB|nr:hypothetical protein [Paenibacillus sp. GP183]SEB46094.1 hypothetical protein SAMN05443246_0481 [Paenibacillus sp. GP183]